MWPSPSNAYPHSNNSAAHVPTCGFTPTFRMECFSKNLLSQNFSFTGSKHFLDLTASRYKSCVQFIFRTQRQPLLPVFHTTHLAPFQAAGVTRNELLTCLLQCWDYTRSLLLEGHRAEGMFREGRWNTD